MFTPRVALEARDWLRRGNPRQAAEVLRAAGAFDHRDVVAVRQQVQAALVQLAQQEQSQGAFWGAWEAVELARKLAPLNGEGRTLYEELHRQARRRQARREAAREIEEQARKWLAEGQCRQAARLLERYLDECSQQSAGSELGSLTKLLAQARGFVGVLEEVLAPIRKAISDENYELAWQLCAEVEAPWRSDGELDFLKKQAGEALARRLLPKAQQALQAGQIECARSYLDRVRQLCPQLESVPEFAELERLMAAKEQERATARKREQAGELVQELQTAIDRGDLPLALRRLSAARELISRDGPQLQMLAQKVRELETSQSGRPGQPQPVRDRSKSLLLGDQWLVISTDEVTVGGRGSDRATLILSAPLRKRHALLIRDRKGYVLQPVTPESGSAGAVLVNGQPIGTGWRLAHGDLIAWYPEGDPWRFEMPVPGSLTATLVLEDLQGCPVVTSGGACRKVLLLADEALLAGQRKSEGHGVLPGLPGRLRLAWREDGLWWHLKGCQLEGEPLDAPPSQGIVCVPSRLVVQNQVSEAQLLEAAMKGHSLQETFSVRWTRA